MTQNSTSPAAVLQVFDAPEDVERAIGSARSLVEAIPGIRVRIVVSGPALDGLSGAELGGLPENAGVAACRVSLRRREIDESSLPEGVEVVPGASATIVQEQLAGAAYMRV